MKKILSLVLITLVCTALFVGCGSETKASSLTSQQQEIIRSAVATVDSYLGADISSVAAETKLDALYKQFEKTEGTSTEDSLNVSTSLLLLSTSFSSSSGKADKNKVVKNRNDLAVYIGMQKKEAQ